MTEAQRQIETAAAQDKRAKGMKLAGYRPLVGLPTHPDGSLRLRLESARQAMAEMIEPLPVSAERGIWKEVRQGELL